MKYCIAFLFIGIILVSCQETTEVSSINPMNWEHRIVAHKPSDALVSGSTYLSVYSQIYSETEKRIHDLTATVSIRNTSRSDTIYIEKAEYFNTKGHFIRNYFKNTIYIAPMETVEIVIDQRDDKGGTGSNFVFDWNIKPNTNEPYFESVMISTYGQQGLSFTSQGKRIK